MLSPHKIDKSIRYNNKRNYDDSFIRATQKVVGSPETGSWDAPTSQAVALWQKRNDLAPDGHVGPKTRSRILIDLDLDPEPKACSEGSSLPPVSVSLWYDHSGVHAAKNADRHTDILCELGVSKVAIMLTSSKRSELPHFKWRLNDLEKFATKAADKDLEIVLTFWPRPRRTYLDALFFTLEEYIEASKAGIIEPDVEGNWSSRHLKSYKEQNPFSSYQEAGEDLIRRMRSAGKGELTLGSTTFADHWELDKRGNASVCGRTDYFALQVYSNYDKGKKAVGTKYGPTSFPSFGDKRARKVGIENSQMALAAWDQDGFPGITPEEAMYMAVKASTDLGCTDLWYWSWKWIAGKFKRKYAFDFIKNLKKKEK